MNRLIHAAGLALALGIVGCADKPTAQSPDGADQDTPAPTREEVVKELREAGEATTRYLDEKEKEFRRDMEERLARLDEDIERLKQRGAELKEEARPQWEQARKELEEKRARLQAKLQQLKERAPGAWQQFRQEAEEAWTDLKQGYDKAARELKDAEQPEEP